MKPLCKTLLAGVILVNLGGYYVVTVKQDTQALASPQIPVFCGEMSSDTHIPEGKPSGHKEYKF